MAGEDLKDGRYPPELLEAADLLTRLVAADEGPEATIAKMAQVAVVALDGATDCTISMRRPTEEGLRTVAATGDVGTEIDRIQSETGEGPCMSSIDGHATLHLVDMERDETWPLFSRRAAAETGIRSMLSFVLRLPKQQTAAMNMMSREVDAFPSEDLDTGTLFAAHLAVALGDAMRQERDRTQIDQLQEALKTRQTIGQAVGIVMATRHVGAEEAFGILKTISQNANVKLREIAQTLVDKADEL